eukprot:jgi/Psemu1/42802/gm1.42802_g
MVERDFDWSALTDMYFSFGQNLCAANSTHHLNDAYAQLLDLGNVDGLFITDATGIKILQPDPITVIGSTIVDAILDSGPYYYAMCPETKRRISPLLAQSIIWHVAAGGKLRVHGKTTLDKAANQAFLAGKQIIHLELSISHWAFQPVWTPYLFAKVSVTPSVTPSATAASPPVSPATPKLTDTTVNLVHLSGATTFDAITSPAATKPIDSNADATATTPDHMASVPPNTVDLQLPTGAIPGDCVVPRVAHASPKATYASLVWLLPASIHSSENTLKIKMYHLHVNILLTTWFSDTIN